MNTEPYLFFEGRCEEALDFYKSAIGAEIVAMMRYSDSPEPPKDGMVPPNSGNKILHSLFRIGQSSLMASDGMCSGKPSFQGVSLAINADSDADAERLFAGLSAGGNVVQPLIETFFATRFGVLADKFGVSWMITHNKPLPKP